MHSTVHTSKNSRAYLRINQGDWLPHTAYCIITYYPYPYLYPFILVCVCVCPRDG